MQVGLGWPRVFHHDKSIHRVFGLHQRTIQHLAHCRSTTPQLHPCVAPRLKSGRSRPPSAMATSAPSSQSSQGRVPGLRLLDDNTQRIDDFEEQLNTMPLTSPPVQPQPFTTLTRTRASTPSSYATADSQPLPVEAGRVWSSESVSQFNNICLKSAVQPIFDFTETPGWPDGRPGWSVKLSFTVRMFDGEEKRYEVSDPGPFTNKKEAKAAASESARGVLERALEERNTQMARRMREDTGSQVSAQPEGSAAAQAQSEQWIPQDENWVGLLAEHCCAVDIPAPSYQEFRNGSNFSVECYITPRPGQPFGERDVLFNSKKSAKRHAARQAVIWLRARGDMPEKGHPSKKKLRAAANATTMAAVNAPSAGPSVLVTSFTSNTNMPAPPPSASEAGGALPSPSTLTAPATTGTAMTTASGATGTSPPSSSSSNSNSPLQSPLPTDLSPGEQLNRLCVSLGIGQPIFRLTPDARVPSMWSGAAYFPYDPVVAAPGEPFGQITNVYGKTNARKEIAKRVMRVLLKMRDDRSRVAEGIVGRLKAAGSASASASANASPAKEWQA
ncbi:hypothetical protein JOL62DRAFT_372993 [Phyllosticta paracitricarpa]|uniref:DRBM domain-containing protein n=1 Tax=Phyllosticta paracitricarpa TaxID=2016321 RepID=A0ABR1MV27_9PEZI